MTPKTLPLTQWLQQHMGLPTRLCAQAKRQQRRKARHQQRIQLKQGGVE